MQREFIIAIDGPSGAGKSTLSRLLARSLRYTNIDTGAMYRAVALAARRAGIDPADEVALEELCGRLRIEFLRGDGAERVLLNGEDVSEAIRTPEVSLLTSRVSACSAVRQAMVRLQRGMGEQGGVVLEGRDIGTVVFPGAEVKFFLLATAAERGRRRYQELIAKGLEVDLGQTIAEVEARDAADSARTHAPLLQAADAVAIDSTSMGIEAVLELMLQEVRRRRELAGLPADR
ncbi:cytidylate kinase [Desulfuromonas versatilis]|uniref:Cytidylate kinase n=1 Tax=Desulfuromonas versatilis TaxID=2802975 RepID=A0ABM8HTW8_9BACT|nr:(d)CMP kinase [Desulfuromonas versatilis]BCR05422.1 cytidylate kinase [Desulfuromonas versatilis]